MAADLITGIGIFKSLYDSAKALKDINDASVRNAAVIDLQEKILAAQHDQSSLVDRIRELEDRARTHDIWNTEKERYELKDLGWGAYAFMLKTEQRNDQPPHWVCTNCFGRQHISIIQNSHVAGQGDRIVCPACKTQINPSQKAYGDNGEKKWIDN